MSAGPHRLLAVGAALLALSGPSFAQDVRLPLRPGSLRFAVIGDAGSGARQQYEVGSQLAFFRGRFPFELVLMLGDNLYGADGPEDYRRKFEAPYKDLLGQGVKFRAVLGNHDNPNQRFYKLFNMGGKRYYTFRPQHGVRFFALDSNYLDRTQQDWLAEELRESGSDWKICFFHHPLYSSAATNGPAVDTRRVLEPLLVQHGVSVVFAGHEHVYERIKPQSGVYHFTSGGAGRLRKGDLRPSRITAAGFDRDFHFMLVEIAGDEMHFQAVSRPGNVVDAGVIRRLSVKAASKEQP